MGKLKDFFQKNKRKKEETIIRDYENEVKSIEIDKVESLEEKVVEEVKTEKKSKNKSTADLMDECRQIIETTHTLDELKGEYQAVTAYLSDIQKIEQIPKEERETINEIARKILTLTKDQERYKKGTRKITDVQYKHMEKYEDEIPKQLRLMQSNESYRDIITKDMKYLEREKEDLFGEKEDILQKQSYLKGIAIAVCTLVILLFLLFVGVNKLYQVDLALPFLLTIILAFVGAAYIFINARKNRKDMKIVELKLNKAIGLLNKVKIKYINNTNALDYAYEKYRVESYEQFKSLWEEYIKAKNDEEKLEQSTTQLDINKKELIKRLRSYNLSDAKIWVFQTTALLDSKEMVEVRHALNVRRQKLRENIDYNNELRDKSLKEVGEFINKSPESKEEIAKLLRSYGIDI